MKRDFCFRIAALVITIGAFMLRAPRVEALGIANLASKLNPKRLKARPLSVLFPWMRRGIEEARDGQKKSRKDNPHSGDYSISFPTGNGGLQTFSYFAPLAEGNAAMTFKNEVGVDVTWIGRETKKVGVQQTSRWRKEEDKVTHFSATNGKKRRSIAKKPALGGTLHFLIEQQVGKEDSARFSLLERVGEDNVVAFHDSELGQINFFRQRVAGQGVSGWLHLRRGTFAEALTTPLENWNSLNPDEHGRALAEAVDKALGNLYAASAQISGVERLDESK